MNVKNIVLASFGVSLLRGRSEGTCLAVIKFQIGLSAKKVETEV